MYLVERPTATVSLLGAPGPRQPEVVLDRFAFDRTDLTADHQRKIDQLADQIVASWKSNRPALGVEMAGHTDQQGDVDYNNDLGRRRAERVLKALSDAVWKRDVDVQRLQAFESSLLSAPFPISPFPVGPEWGQFLFGVGARRLPGSLDIDVVNQWRDIAWSEARRRLGQ